VDLDGDGYVDLISGSWPGEIFFFKGGPNHTFAPPVKLKDKFGKTINIGGGIRQNTGEQILIAGDAQFEEKDKKTFLIYEDQRIELANGQQAGITGTASTVHAVDWDGDGRIDLLIGDIGGNVYLIPNEGTPKAYAFGKPVPLQAGGKAIQVPGGDAGPFAADWDGDGRLDLLVGAGDGSVWFYRNIGTNKAPELAAGVQLVPPSQNSYYTSKVPLRGIRAKVCAVDWNGDGRLDLLVGDFTMQKPNLPEPTPEKKAEQDKYRTKLKSIEARYHELAGKLYGQARVKEKEERDKFQKELSKVSQEMTELRSKLPPEYEQHGWVWLYLRKPADTKTAARKSGK
jgi:hypothetical protein